MFKLIYFVFTGKFPCNHSYELIDTGNFKSSFGEVGVLYVSRCKICGKLVSKNFKV